MSIPQTLAEARIVGNIRFHEWNENCIDLVQEILDSGREVDVMGHVDPIAQKIQALAIELDECRLMSAIAKIAVALGAKVENY